MDVVRAVSDLGSLRTRPDGTTYYVGAFGFPTIECGSRTLEACAAATIGPYILPTLDPYGSTAAIIDIETRLAKQLSLEARSQLSFLPANANPTLAKVTELANSTIGLVPLLEQFPVLGSTVNAAAARVDANIEATTVRDPRDGLSALELYLANRDRSAMVEASTTVALERARAEEFLMSIYGDFFGSSSGLSIPSFLPGVQTTFGQNGLDPLGGSVIFGGGEAAPPMDGSGGGTIFDALIGAIPTVLKGVVDLSRAGVIRGSVGQAFGGPVGASQPASPMSVAPMGGNMALTFDQALQYALSAVTMSQNGIMVGEQTVTMDGGAPAGAVSPAQLLGAGGCGPRGPRVVNVMTAPGIYGLTCNGFRPVSKVIAEDAKGNRDLFVRVGRIVGVSNRTAKRFAKRWAREAGLVVSARGAGRRGRRRPR